MGKKIALKIGLLLFLVCLVVPLLVEAQQEQPNDCCKVRQKFKAVDCSFGKNCVIGQKDGYCEIGTTEYTLSTVLTPGPTCTCGIGSAEEVKYFEKWGMVCLLSSIYNVTNWVFYLLTIIAVLMIIFGGATYMTAAGDPDKASKGKSILTFAVIGFAIALIAKVIPSIVRVIVGM